MSGRPRGYDFSEMLLRFDWYVESRLISPL